MSETELARQQDFRLEELKGELSELRKALTLSVRGELQERTRREILELIAWNRPLDDILTRLEALVEMRMFGAACSALAFPLQSDPLAVAERSAEDALGPAPAWGPEALDPVRCGLVHPAIPGWWRDKGLRHGWHFPILFGTGPQIGVMCLGFRDARTLNPEELKQVETYSRIAGMAIHHSHLLEVLSRQARYDSLTGLPNRVLFQDRLEQAIHQAQRTDFNVGVLFLDLDGFKHINDTLGHDVGDKLLVEASNRLRDMLRQADTLARMGGDEFTLLLPSLKDPTHAGRVAEKCLDVLREPFHIQDHELFVTGSLGISVYPQDAKDPGQLHRNADSAMYQAKARGKNGFAYFTPDLNLRAQERLELEGQLRRALDQGEFQLYYQPQFRLDGSISGCEALLRWFHPRLGPISPARFIPVAEENGFILPIGNWVLKEACRQLAAWNAPNDFLMAVNVSSLQFQREDWADQVAAVLSEVGLHPSRLELELTESLVMDNPLQAATRLTALRKLGVRVAVDDFGTGYSSLSYLQRFPLDTLKIDQSFVRDIFPANDQPSSGPIVQTIVALARSLNLSLMAEGVETEEQAAYLRELRCEGMQGYLFGRPMPAEAFEKLLG